MLFAIAPKHFMHSYAYIKPEKTAPGKEQLAGDESGTEPTKAFAVNVIPYCLTLVALFFLVPPSVVWGMTLLW